MSCPCPKHPLGCYLHPIGCGCENESLRAQLASYEHSNWAPVKKLRDENESLRAQLASARKAAIEECAKIAEKNTWEATAAEIRALSLTDEKGQQ